MNAKTANEFAQWLQKNQPSVFASLASQDHAANGLGFWDSVSDVLSKVGTNITNVVSKVGSFVASPAGLATIGTVGASILQVQSQKNALDLQTKLAAAGRPLAPIETVYNTQTGQYEATLQTTQGARPLTTQVAADYLRTNWLPFALIGVTLLAFILLRRK